MVFGDDGVKINSTARETRRRSSSNVVRVRR
jgi:hypothetical protein